MEGSRKGRRPLTYDDRVAIEHGLNRGDRISWIARSIGRTQHMVAQEVKRNWTDDPRGHLTIQNRNICVKYAECEVRRLCKTMCMAPCRKCRDIPFGMRSLYNYLGGAKMGSLTKLDLPKAVRYKPRAKSGDGGKSPQIPRAALEGRRWSDFQMLDAADRDNAVEMDTVVGRNGVDRQCILTMMVRRIGFQFYILLPDKTADCVIAAIDTFCDLYGERFGKVFGLVVADRGTEFSNPERIECGRNGKRRLKLYYTDPQQSQQKPKAERRHAELRRILPKGKTDFDALTGRDMAVCMSHVNSYMVGSMGWASPMDLAMALFPRDLVDAYGIEKVDPKEVNLTPYLVPHAIVKK